MIKNVGRVELSTKTAADFLNTQTLKIIWKNTNVWIVTRIIKESLMKT